MIFGVGRCIQNLALFWTTFDFDRHLQNSIRSKLSCMLLCGLVKFGLQMVTNKTVVWIC